MTKSGSFKRVVRKRAEGSGKRYTQALAEVNGDAVATRVQAATKWRGKDRLPEHIESAYGVRVDALATLSPHGGGVFRVDRSDGPAWVARVFPRDAGHVPSLDGDVRVLRLLEAHDFPAERVVGDGLSTFDGQRVLLTTHVAGEPAAAGPAAMADFAGRLHALPVTKAQVGRDGGAFGHDPVNEGRPVRDLDAAAGFLDVVEASISSSGRAVHDSLREGLATADGCDGLPEALTTPNVCDRDVIVQADGTCAGVDWKPAGWGPRLPALAFLLHCALGKSHPMEPPAGTINVPMIEAMVSAYRRHVTLTAEELHRLPAAIRIYSMYFACWYHWIAVSNGVQPAGQEGWLPRHDLTDAIAAVAVERLKP